MDATVDRRRVRSRNNCPQGSGPVLYWMRRDQRTADNWALLYAQELAHAQGVPLVVSFNLAPGFLGGGRRQHVFKVDGVREVAATLADYDIPFYLLQGQDTQEDIVSFVQEYEIGAVVTDFFPLHLPQSWVSHVAEHVSVPVYEVDTHNVVPCWQASDKQEYAARTIRPKIHRQLEAFLTEFPELQRQQHSWPHSVPDINWQAVRDEADVDDAVPPVDWLEAGEQAGQAMLQTFLDQRLHRYAEDRNDPNVEVLSNLSPYFHFGHVSAQRVALAVESRPGTRREDKDAYLEELIVRKELSDNYCFYQPNYDSPEGFPRWAIETLGEHKDDEREYVYTKREFENAETHDELWNAAQMEMVRTGKMHGFMRMYWAKKLLEWTNTPRYAQEIGIYLNDKYELDGRDPNGYVGVAWSVGGVHDRAWPERDVFGKVRYMNRSGCERKFDVERYIATHRGDTE